MTEPIYIEAGQRWSYAGSVEWPGWTRHAKDDQEPISELLAVAPRYQAALAMCGLDFVSPEDPEGVEVVARLAGNSGTDRGVPSMVPEADGRPLDDAEADRLASILAATWRAFDTVVEAAQGNAFANGPAGWGA